MRVTALIGFAAGLVLTQAGAPAQAGLIGDGTNTVSATSFFAAASAPLPPYPNTMDYVNSMGMTTDDPPPTIPVTFMEDLNSETTTMVGDTQITITNNAPTGSPFTAFSGFGYTFSTGVDITGVSVDPMSSPDFRPNTTSPHMGLQLLSPTDILVDVSGDAPNTGDQLILDVTTGGTTTPVPEPASLALLGVGLAGMCAAGARERRVRG